MSKGCDSISCSDPDYTCKTVGDIVGCTASDESAGAKDKKTCKQNAKDAITCEDKKKAVGHFVKTEDGKRCVVTCEKPNHLILYIIIGAVVVVLIIVAIMIMKHRGSSGDSP